jgi:sugar phosphate isomerase/epimerase
MTRAITLFTGQWADLSLEKPAPLAKRMGYDGLGLFCWGDHFDVEKTVSSREYVRGKWALLEVHGVTGHALPNHLIGQAICGRIDTRRIDFPLNAVGFDAAFDRKYQ